MSEHLRSSDPLITILADMISAALLWEAEYLPQEDVVDVRLTAVASGVDYPLPSSVRQRKEDDER